MKEKEINKLKATINERLKKIQSDGRVSSGSFNDLLKIIHNLEFRVRKKFKNEYDKINRIAFQKGIKLDGYQPKVYFDKNTSSKKPTTRIRNKERTVGKIDLLYEKAKSRFKFFPRHIFLKFTNNNKYSYKIILLYNHETEPLFLKKIKQEIKEAGFECKILQIEDFIDGLKNGKLRNYNYLAFFIFKVKSNPQKYIENLFTDFEGYFSIAQIKYGEFEGGFKYEKQLESIKRELEYVMMVEFINIDLNHHELKVMKLLFGANKTNQIHYQLNTKGFSGSTVISVQPFSYNENPQKYIIKISDKKDDKLQIEKDKFKEFVETNDPLYGIEVGETEKSFAIRYHYATSDSEIDSFSFGDILKMDVSDYTLDIKRECIKKLFQTHIYTRWDDSQNDDVQINYSNYKDYINLKEIKKQLLKIKDCQNADDLEIVKIFNKVKNLGIDGKTQICHGDLHTENFFIDNEDNVFLIDFGDVGIHHNMIDYAMLETSIKLNHTPNYVPNEMLFQVEKELLKHSTFNSNYTFKSIRRDDLINIYSLITCIRELVLEKIIDENEYYYSLFMLTFRQIRYSNLNQLYAIDIAKKIGEKLIRDLNN